MKKLWIVITSTLIFGGFIATAAYLDIVNYAHSPAGGDPIEQVVEVKPGQGFQSVAKMLHNGGLIEHPFKFRVLARLKGYEKKIKAGEYGLSAAMTPGKILEVMVHGKVLLHRLTIPEGYNLKQVGQAVSKAGFGTESDFLQAGNDPDLVRSLGIDAETFEGYLFPDTYYFPKGTPPEKIISTMVKRFRSVFLPEWKERAKSMGLTVHQVVTLASIIEKETGVPSERPVISSVFHNRLNRKMRLESDPTVIYGIKNFNGNITRKDLVTSTPYNTYTISGLPPGPISNTGLGALEAALYPADTEFLFFVSRKDRTHQFSTNIRDHNRAVRKYQLGR